MARMSSKQKGEEKERKNEEPVKTTQNKMTDGSNGTGFSKIEFAPSPLSANLSLSLSHSQPFSLTLNLEQDLVGIICWTILKPFPQIGRNPSDKLSKVQS